MFGNKHCADRYGKMTCAFIAAIAWFSNFIQIDGSECV